MYFGVRAMQDVVQWLQERQESDRLVISMPMSCPTTSTRPSIGSHMGHMGAAGLIAAGQHEEMFL